MFKLSVVKSSLERHYNSNKFDLDIETQSGGDIHQSFAVKLRFNCDLKPKKNDKKIFLKTNSGSVNDVLASEFESLKKLNALCPTLYPQAIAFERIEDKCLLFMSFHELSEIKTSNASDAGRALAKHHKINHDNFGWHSDNYIGLTPQSNKWNTNWVTFYREQRLAPMIERATSKGLPNSMADQSRLVVKRLDELLSHEVIPALVHGDLWSGNLAIDETKQQTLFYDPAPYFGDREVDLAMTQLFGRQPESFYQAYQEEWPLATGYEKRISVYNLYHALNHVVLFGSPYFALVDNCLRQILNSSNQYS